MKNKIFMGIAAVAMVAVLSSCGKKPQVEIDATNTAIEAAKTAEAAVYVPTEFAAVQDSMTAIMADVAAQESKLFKKYGPAKLKLVATLDLAKKVATDAAAKKEEVKKEAEASLAGIKTVLDENKTLMTKAPRGKEGAAVLEQIKTESAGIESSVAEAQCLFDKGTYMDALNKIKAATVSANNINTELKDAIAKVKGGKAKPAAAPAKKK